MSNTTVNTNETTIVTEEVKSFQNEISTYITLTIPPKTIDRLNTG